MSKPWSKLQKEYYLLVADGLKIQLQCRAYRMASNYGDTNIPRYWLTLGKEVLWDYPGDFMGRENPERAPTGAFPYIMDVSDISSLLREYIDTPKDAVFNRVFEHDHWGLTDILKASDKRIGRRRLPLLKEKLSNPAAIRVIEARLT
ncbi:hypothetical protein CS022_18225 [Veronia nyctiphanis]|uniref:Uncharacterized protein n=1 Tax=Veronia nyctiphanis TaxID=1278244 RepID=A0A4Q0YNL9_9GAMM|nr:hypothetical protein [Veronia nyctiphanis]RXJ72016.1 hypothetical protein CS022_17945 [Veronia nyctiphanis]RXJ72063.1 hypothetical protein CS022_18225 [Veronia nyctiphanis]